MPGLAQYAGPAILSRGEAPSAMAAPEIRFRPFLEISAVWDTGLANVGVTDTGSLASASSVGMSLAWGVSGTHSWRYYKLGLDYRGSIEHYFKNSFYDSLNQSLLMGITHPISRRISTSVHLGAGQFSRDFGLLGLPQNANFDPSSTYIPTTDFFDNRTVYFTASVEASIRETARLSFNFGGSGFIVRRRSTALYGSVGAGAQADMQYRLSRRTTIGTAYSYQHFDYNHIFGGTDMHQATATYAVQISRLAEFSAYAGAAFSESKFIQQIAIDPSIAALLGITQASLVGYGVHWDPAFSARLSRAFQRGVAYVGVSHTITPGNGLFLTSTVTSADAGYNYTWKRRWSFGAAVDYARAKSIGNIMGVYAGVSGTVNASRQIWRFVHFTSSFSARSYSSPDYHNYNRVIYSAMAGLGFSPGDVPLRIW
jgi:hypothetical protein